MNRELGALLELRDGVVTSAQVRQVVPRWVLHHAVRSGQLLRQYPRVYVAAAQAADPMTRRRAALAYAGHDAALSHTSALAMWGLDCDDPEVHLTTAAGRRLDRQPGLAVHRRAGFTVASPQVLNRQGQPVVALERAMVESWPLSTGASQRAPLIQAVAERMTTPERVEQAMATVRALPGRRALRHLLGLLTAGCRSELEIWGYESVFTGPGMPPFRHQVPVRLGSRTIYLDVYAEAARVNFELDGGQWHTAVLDRERDLRRDAALAARGILVVRLTHRQLRQADPVRRLVQAILTGRRATAS